MRLWVDPKLEHLLSTVATTPFLRSHVERRCFNPLFEPFGQICEKGDCDYMAQNVYLVSKHIWCEAPAPTTRSLHINTTRGLEYTWGQGCYTPPCRAQVYSGPWGEHPWRHVLGRQPTHRGCWLKFYMERELGWYLSGNEVYFTACSLLVMWKNLCSKLNYHRGLNLVLFSYKIVGWSSLWKGFFQAPLKRHLYRKWIFAPKLLLFVSTRCTWRCHGRLARAPAHDFMWRDN